MLEFIFIMILGSGLCIAAYYAVIHIIKLWAGCDINEAATKLHNAINGKAHYTFQNDCGFEQAVSDTVRSIIGDKRYEQLIKLSRTALDMPLLSYGYNSGLPYVAISVYYVDDNEKQVLENLLTELVRRYLMTYGYCEQVLVDWKRRYDLQMPVLQIRYAQNKEEKRILAIGLQNSRQAIISQNASVIDDTDDEELDE